MTLTIEHPVRKHHVPILPALVALAVSVVLAVGALQVSGVFTGNDPAPNSPANRAPTVNQGPNVGLPLDWASQSVAVIAASTAVGGPNVGLAPDWISQHAAERARAVAADGPNAELAPDWTSRNADIVTGRARGGPNAGLAPDWTGQEAA